MTLKDAMIYEQWTGEDRRKAVLASLEVLICNYLDTPIELINSLSQVGLYLDIQYGIKARSFTDWAKFSVGKKGRKNEFKLLLEKVRKNGKKRGRKEGRNKNKEGKQIKRRRNKAESSRLSSPSARTRVQTPEYAVLSVSYRLPTATSVHCPATQLSQLHSLFSHYPFPWRNDLPPSTILIKPLLVSSMLDHVLVQRGRSKDDVPHSQSCPISPATLPIRWASLFRNLHTPSLRKTATWKFASCRFSKAT
jgi:hypothetical protein